MWHFFFENFVVFYTRMMVNSGVTASPPHLQLYIDLYKIEVHYWRHFEHYNPLHDPYIQCFNLY